MPAGAESSTAAHAASTENMDFDSHSGRTIHADSPWIEVLHSRIKKKTAHAPSIVTNHNTASLPAAPSRDASTQRRNPLPRLPPNNYTVIYRPRSGLNLSAWSPRLLTQSLAMASNIPQQEFFSQVTIQIQILQNLIVASTPSETHAITLSRISSIQLKSILYELVPYLKPPPDTCRGVIHGLDPGTTNENLPDLLIANGPRLLHSRMLGRTTSALLTFQGPHVPFFVKVGSLIYRCRPFRRTVQFCRLCGEVGHRQDVCPHPDQQVCISCGTPNPTDDHRCSPNCKLCDLPHITASKDCPQRLIPTPSVVRRKHQVQPPVSTSNSKLPDATTNQARTTKPVSWSQAVRNAPTAQHFPPLPSTQSTTQTHTTVHTHTTPATSSTTTIEGILTELRNQNAMLLRRVEALEQESRTRSNDSARQHEDHAQAEQCALSSSPSAPLPPAITAEEVSALIDSKIQVALVGVNQTLATTTQSIVQLGETITARIAALEQSHSPIAQMLQSLHHRLDCLELEQPHNPKKPKIDQSSDEQLASMTPLPDD